jgi:small subunit ribosomal protein S6e
MAEYKVNIGVKGGKTHKLELKDAEAKALQGKKIGDKVTLQEFSGYEFEITGGSDYCGFPMRKDVQGPARKRILITGGVGFRNKRKGMRARRNVAGNTIHEQTAQVNLKVLKEGKQPLFPEPEAAPEAEAKVEEQATPAQS